jgi:hypothetical protein
VALFQAIKTTDLPSSGLIDSTFLCRAPSPSKTIGNTPTQKMLVCRNEREMMARTIDTQAWKKVLGPRELFSIKCLVNKRTLKVEATSV